jgi:enoyl-CoA hydratase/carnithine racemase
MLMTGLPLTAEDALNFGLISKLAKDAEHLEQVKNYKKTFTDHSGFEYLSCDRPGTIFRKSLNIFDFIRDPNYKLLWIFFRSWIALLMPSNQNQEVLLLW